MSKEKKTKPEGFFYLSAHLDEETTAIYHEIFGIVLSKTMRKVTNKDFISFLIKFAHKHKNLIERING